MTINRQYEDLLARVLAEGTVKTDRTGVGTVSLFGAQMRFDLREGFPLITTKKVFLRGIAEELFWFLNGDTRVSTLQEKNVHIWDQWCLDDGTIGPGYGAMWRSWPTTDGGTIDQISDVVEQIKANPDSRRLIVTAWNPEFSPKAALPPCHSLFQFGVADGRLSCHLFQRSGDLFLGVPFNIASYSLLTHMIAQQTGLDVGDFVWTGTDCHVYSNHLDQVREQLSREPYEFPRLRLRKAPSLFEYRWEDIEVVGYQHHPTIKAPVAV